MKRVFKLLGALVAVLGSYPVFAACDLGTSEAKKAFNHNRKIALMELYLRRARAFTDEESETMLKHKGVIFGTLKGDSTIPCGEDVLKSCKDPSSLTGGLHSRETETTKECREALNKMAAECRGGLSAIVGMSEDASPEKMKDQLSAYYRYLTDMFMESQDPQRFGPPTSIKGLPADRALALQFKEKLEDTDFWIKGTSVCTQQYPPAYVYEKSANKKCEDQRPDPTTRTCAIQESVPLMQYNTNRIEGLMKIYSEYSAYMRSRAPFRKTANNRTAVANAEAVAYSTLESSARTVLEGIPKQDSEKITQQMGNYIRQMEDWLSRDPREKMDMTAQAQLAKEKAYLKTLKDNVDNVDFWMAGHILCQKPLPAPFMVQLETPCSAGDNNHKPTNPSGSRTTI